MTKLSNFIPLEYVKQNKKLQEITSEKMDFYANVEWVQHDPYIGEWVITDKINLVYFEDICEHGAIRPMDRNSTEKSIKMTKDWQDKIEFYPAPTIADIIDNAEMLFPKRLIQTGDNTHCHNSLLIPQAIVHMCQQDKSIEEVSKYIIDNIK